MRWACVLDRDERHSEQQPNGGGIRPIFRSFIRISRSGTRVPTLTTSKQPWLHGSTTGKTMGNPQCYRPPRGTTTSDNYTVWS